MDNIYKNIEESNTNKERKRLIIFDDIYPDTLSNKKRNSIVTELFIGGRKLNIFLLRNLLHGKTCFLFFKCSEKIVFPKNLQWNIFFLYYLVFLKNIILFFRRRMKDGFSQKIHGNMIFFCIFGKDGISYKYDTTLLP